MERFKGEKSVSSSINVVHSENLKPGKLSDTSNLNVTVTKKRKTLFAHFKAKQRNIYGFALIDTGNLVHSAFVSWDFWESIGARSTVQWTME